MDTCYQYRVREEKTFQFLRSFSDKVIEILQTIRITLKRTLKDVLIQFTQESAGNPLRKYASLIVRSWLVTEIEFFEKIIKIFKKPPIQVLGKMYELIQKVSSKIYPNIFNKSCALREKHTN